MAVLVSPLMASAGVGCRNSEPAPEPAHTAPALDQPPSAAAPQLKTPPPEVGTAFGDVPPAFPKPGWSSRRLRDALPLCVFSSQEEREKAPFIQDVHKQVLSANTKVVFGVFGPGCLNEACDARPMLQCWAEQDGHTLIVNSRFFSFHNDGSSCDSDCLEVDSSCDTPVLKPGKYTVRHGDKTYKLQIPSTLNDPCFSRE
jgi:hypothetical protein